MEWVCRVWVWGFEGNSIGVLFQDTFGSEAWAKGFDALMRQGFGTDKELGYCIGSVGRDGGVHHGLRNEAGHCCNLGVHIDTLAQISHPVQDSIISDHNHLTKVLIHIVALNLSIYQSWFPSTLFLHSACWRFHSSSLPSKSGNGTLKASPHSNFFSLLFQTSSLLSLPRAFAYFIVSFFL